AGGNQPAAVRAPGEGRNAIRMARELRGLLVAIPVPDANRTVFAGRGDELAAGSEGNRRNAVRMGFDFAEQSLRGRVPQANRAIVVTAGQGSAVVAEGESGYPRGLCQAAQQLARGGIPDEKVIVAAGEQAGL